MMPLGSDWSSVPWASRNRQTGQHSGGSFGLWTWAEELQSAANRKTRATMTEPLRHMLEESFINMNSVALLTADVNSRWQASQREVGVRMTASEAKMAPSQICERARAQEILLRRVARFLVPR